MKGYDFLEKSPFYKFKNEEGTYHFFDQISDKTLEQGIIFTHLLSPFERPFFLYINDKGINRKEIERTPDWFQTLFEKTNKKYDELTRLREIMKGAS